MKGRYTTRWRDPKTDPRQETKSNVITADGFKKLQQLLNHLVKERRPYYSQKVNEAAAQGDRSENADYQYNKRQLNKIIGRIAYLSKRLDVLRVIDELPRDQHRIYFGAFVCLTDLSSCSSEKVIKFRIVGPDESNASEGLLNIDAPLARSLLGKQVGETVSLSTGHNKQSYAILNISYDNKL